MFCGPPPRWRRRDGSRTQALRKECRRKPGEGKLRGRCQEMTRIRMAGGQIFTRGRRSPVLAWVWGGRDVSSLPAQCALPGPWYPCSQVQMQTSAHSTPLLSPGTHITHLPVSAPHLSHTWGGKMKSSIQQAQKKGRTRQWGGSYGGCSWRGIYLKQNKFPESPVKVWGGTHSIRGSTELRSGPVARGCILKKKTWLFKN